MKDEKDLYKPRTFRPSKDEKIEVLDFISKQKNFNDTIRYLIEKEIAENGIRNLQEHIPSERSPEYFSSVYKNKGHEDRNIKVGLKEEIDQRNINVEIKEIDHSKFNEVSVTKENDKNNNIETEDTEDKDTEEIPECFDD